MHNFFVSNPIGFINSATNFQKEFVIFCATTLGTLTILWALIFILFRAYPKTKNVYASAAALRSRLGNVLLLAVSMLVAYFASVVLKNYFQIGRPEILNFGLYPLLPLSNYGFPSSHAAVFAALATALFFLHRRAGIFVGLLALIICAARIFAGVHTPLDIFGGYLLGVLISCVVAFIAQKTSRKAGA